jgi:hypothetical protein
LIHAAGFAARSRLHAFDLAAASVRAQSGGFF